MNYGDEIERIADECRRRSAMLAEEFAAINRRTVDTSRALAEASTVAMRQFWEEQLGEIAQTVERTEESEQYEVEELTELERFEADAREQREAIARSIAARRANEVVTPVDEDADPESAYYRRKSWLI